MTLSIYVTSALLVLLSASSLCSAFVLPQGSRSTGISTCRQVASKDATSTSTDEAQSSYQLSRGDGSTGGGGLAMPNMEDEDDDGLVRPKVSPPFFPQEKVSFW
jgi:hypothetical protein